MQKAYQNLKLKKKLKSSINISTTDYYVRFFPKNENELQELEADSLILFNYPLDYEIKQTENTNEEPSLEDTQNQWYYTSVPVDYKFPDVEYEILAELFLPESIENSKVTKSSSSIQFLYELEDEALRITGNYTQPEEYNDNPTLKRASKKAPEGYVKVYDSERKSLVSVEGVRVRTRRWFKYGLGWTNYKGYYKVNNSYRRDVQYSILFENNLGFKIRAYALSATEAIHHVGSHNRNGYNFNIYQYSRAWRFCTVNNAVLKYRKYCDQFKIGKPYSDLRISVSDKSGGSAAPMFKYVWGFYGFTSKSKVLAFLGKIPGLIVIPTTLGLNTSLKFILPDIILQANSLHETAALYEVCFHELSHASHFKKVGSAFWIKYINYISTYGAYGTGKQNNAGLCALGEAWAYNLGYRLTLEEYNNVGNSKDNSDITWKGFENFEPRKTGRKDDYLKTFYDPSNPDKRVVEWYGWIPAGIMNDIIDTNADFIRTGYKDNVSGYTYHDLFDALDSDVDTPQKFRDRLLRENGNKDKTDLENLFEAYYWN